MDQRNYETNKVGLHGISVCSKKQPMIWDFIHNEKAPTPRSKVELFGLPQRSISGERNMCPPNLCNWSKLISIYLQSIDLMHWKYPELEETIVGWVSTIWDPTYRTKKPVSLWGSGAAGYSLMQGIRKIVNRSNHQPSFHSTVIWSSCHVTVA